MIDKVVRPLPKLPNKFYNEYVIDVETTGLNENEDIIICLGIGDLQKRIASIYFLNDHTKWNDFQNFCRKKALELLNHGRVWAYNKNFEERFLRVQGINELLCMGSGFSFRHRLASASDEVIYKYELCEILKDLEKELDHDPISGDEVPLLYMKKYIIFKDKKAKQLIINHNYYDLVRAYIIRYHIAELAREITKTLFTYEVIPLELYHIINELC